MIIRCEEKRDYNEIKLLVKSAFETATHSDGNEYILVDKLRQSSGFIKELALVAEENSVIVGHIMFTVVKVCDKTGVALAPLSVLPSFQKKGVGTRLMKKAHKIAKDMGFEFSLVLGSENYYPKVGYRPAIDFGVLAKFDCPSENFMILILNGDGTNLNGTAQYVKELS